MRAGLALWLAAACGGRADSEERGALDPDVEEEERPGADCAGVDCPAPGSALPEEPDVRRGEGSDCGVDGIVWGSVELESQSPIDALEGCERVAGDLKLSARPGFDLAPLLALRSVDGTLRVTGSGETALECFASLEDTGALHLDGLTVPDLRPLGRVRRIKPGPAVSASAPMLYAGAEGLQISSCSGAHVPRWPASDFVGSSSCRIVNSRRSMASQR